MSGCEVLGDGESLVVSSETRQGIGMRIFFALLLNGFAALITVVSYLGPVPHDATWVGTMIGWHTVVVTASVVVLVLSAWGTWVIDLEGVTFEPCQGAPRRIEWSHVERVQWYRYAREVSRQREDDHHLLAFPSG
jgi:hypothetical protein